MAHGTTLPVAVAANLESLKASEALNDATKQALLVGASEELLERIRSAQHRLTSPRSSLEGAVDARAGINLAVSISQDAALTDLLAKAEKRVRDTLILRTQERMDPNCADRNAFVECLENAHAKFKETVEDDEYRNELSRCMHSYRAVIQKQYPHLAFASKSKQEASARGQKPRPKRPRDRGAKDEETGDFSPFMPPPDESAFAMPHYFDALTQQYSAMQYYIFGNFGWSDPLLSMPGISYDAEGEHALQPWQEEPRNQTTLQYQSMGKPPGLVAPGLEIKPDASSWDQSSLKMEPMKLETKQMVHASGARTQGSAASITLELDYSDPSSAMVDARRHSNYLVLFELRALHWRTEEDRGAQLGCVTRQMPNNYFFHVRPGADKLLAGLLDDSKDRYRLAFLSTMGHWHCVPAARMLLEQAVANTSWAEEGDLFGKWTCYRENNRMYTIEDSQCTWTDRYGEQTATFVLTCPEKKKCSVSMPGKTWHGHLTADGFLEWTDGYETSVWVRAARRTPPCLVCRERGWRVYVFDCDGACERVEQTTEDSSSTPSAAHDHGHDGGQGSGEVPHEQEPGWFRKDFDKIWSALADAKWGAFGTRDTVLVDDTPGASHPENVIQIRRWKDWEDGSGMDALREYLVALADAAPGDVSEHLRRVPCNAFSSPLP